MTWNQLDRYELAPSTPVTVPVTLIGLQLVGLNVKPGTVDSHVDRLDVSRDTVEDLWEGVRGIGSPWATRKRSKRDNRQAGQRLMTGPTRKRSKRDNRRAGRQLVMGPTRKRSKRGNRQATRVRMGLSLRCGVAAVSGVMALQSSAGRPPFGFFLMRRLARPSLSSDSSASRTCAAG